MLLRDGSEMEREIREREAVYLWNLDSILKMALFGRELVDDMVIMWLKILYIEK